MVWPACTLYMGRAPGCIQSSAKRAQGFAFHGKSFYVCEWIEQIAMKYLNAQSWSHNGEVKCQIMALLMEDGRILFNVRKASVQTTPPDLWCFLPYPLPFVPILAAFSSSSVSILFFIFIHRCFLCFSLATETYLLASWSHLCSCIVKLPPAVALHGWRSFMPWVGSSSFPQCQDFTPWVRQAGHCPLGMGLFLKKRGWAVFLV